MSLQLQKKIDQLEKQVANLQLLIAEISQKSPNSLLENVSVQEAATLLKWSRSKVKEAIDQGELGYISDITTTGKVRMRIPMLEIERNLNNRYCPPTYE